MYVDSRSSNLMENEITEAGHNMADAERFHCEPVAYLNLKKRAKKLGISMSELEKELLERHGDTYRWQAEWYLDEIEKSQKK